MKKQSFLLSVIFFLAVSCFAQIDSSAVVGASSWAELHFTFWGKVLAVIAIVSEVLAVIPSKYIPANGVVDAIIKVIKWLASTPK